VHYNTAHVWLTGFLPLPLQADPHIASLAQISRIMPGDQESNGRISTLLSGRWRDQLPPKQR